MNNLKIYLYLSYNKQDKNITFAPACTNNSFSFIGKMLKNIKKYFLVSQCYLILVVFFAAIPAFAQDARFTVVLDAGHGGHDPGAMGAISREKDINLAVVLNLGALIEKNYKDVKVVYTRKTDKYLTLQERADIVNNNHADLFICIHTNAAQSSAAYGAETFTLGLAKSKSNLDVAMRENSVILLEDNYRTKYKGFDPTSVDSYIMFEFMQDKYIDKSIEFSSIIQKQFVSYCRRYDRGVRQAGFWVLHRSACPSVLIELGFISNPAEERYLASSLGQTELAVAIYNAFIDFKHKHDKKSGRQTSTVAPIEKSAVIEQAIVTEETPITSTEEQIVETAFAKPEAPVNQSVQPVENRIVVSKQVPVFKVQLFATTKILKAGSSEFHGVKNVEYFTEGGLNKYTVGDETDYNKIEKIRAEVLSKFPQAFIIAFVDNKKISAKEALKMVNK